jgi:regulator of sigma E protease
MVFLIWEGVTRRKPSEKVLIAASYVGMAFVLGLMLFVIYLDIFVHGSRG